MAKLNQIIALLSGKKTKAKEVLTEAYHAFKKPELFSGLIRTYQPREENGETQPEERKSVQVRVSDKVQAVTDALTDMLDVTLTQDTANCQARADLVVDGRVLVSKVPVTYLLFLEKQLVDLRTFAESIPTLDPAEEWAYSSEADSYVSKPARTNRTKKVPRNHIKYEATKEHPAQVEMYTEDVWVGTWTVTKYSGAALAKDKNDVVQRVAKLLDAVKVAREEANGMEVTPQKIGNTLLSYVFQGK